MSSIKRNNNGKDSRKLLVPVTHPDNLFARTGELERRTSISAGGLIGGGDPTRVAPNPVPLIADAQPFSYYDSVNQRTVLQMVLTLGYTPPVDFIYLEANIFAESGDPGHDQYFTTTDGETVPWTITDNYLTIGATYGVRVRAVTGRGVGNWSDTFSGVTYPSLIVQPSPPTIDSPITGGYNPRGGYYAAVVVRHTGGLDEGGGTLYYQGGRAPGGSSVDIPPGTVFPTTVYVWGLAAGVTYGIRAIVKSASGLRSNPSATVNYTVVGKPQPATEQPPNADAYHPDEYLPGMLQLDNVTHLPIDQTNLPSGIFVERVEDKSYIGRSMMQVTLQSDDAIGQLDFSDTYDSGLLVAAGAF